MNALWSESLRQLGNQVQDEPKVAILAKEVIDPFEESCGKPFILDVLEGDLLPVGKVFGAW
jgi:hypothetical protein